KGATVAAAACRSVAISKPIRGAENAEIECRFGAKSGATFNRNPVPVCSDFCNLVLSESLLRAVVQLGVRGLKTHWLMNPTCFVTGSRPMCNLLVGKSGSG